MKKRKTPISRNIAQVSEALRRQMHVLMNAVDQGKEIHSEQCSKYPPCIKCGKAGTHLRKCYFTLDFEGQLKAFGHTYAMAICPECFEKALTEEDRVFEIVSLKEIGILIK